MADSAVQGGAAAASVVGLLLAVAACAPGEHSADGGAPVPRDAFMGGDGGDRPTDGGTHPGPDADAGDGGARDGTVPGPRANEPPVAT
jgi:hypothetical protein